MKSNRSFVTSCALGVILIVAGCAKKQPPKAPVAPPPPPPAPTASISASPSTLQKGGQTQLTWRTENADDVTIDGIGKVDGNGSRTVSPGESTSYRLLAKGPGGEQDATARVTVTEPPPPSQPVASVSDEEWWSQHVQDVYFDYDSHDVRPDAQRAVTNTAQALLAKTNLRFTIEGHCDERGSTEYNLALGEERAKAVKNALVAAGVDASRINTTTFGKEKPFCSESNEACWQQNRRGHLAMSR